MSLLLDALKKAADEKKKESSASEKDEANQADSKSLPDQDLELDLELAKEDVPEFPEVNQEINKQVADDIEEKKQSESNVGQSEPELEPEPAPPAEIEISDSNDETGPVNSSQNKQQAERELTLETSASIAVDDDASERRIDADSTPAIQNAEANATSVDSTQRDQVAAVEQRHNLDMEALSALINKNNDYRKRTHRVLSLSIIASIIILLLAASFYAYIMIDKVENSRISPEYTEVKIPGKTEATVNSLKAADQIPEKTIKPADSLAPVKQTSVTRQPVKAKPKASNQVRKDAIQIRKKTTDDPIGILLARAYDAFQKADYSASGKLYNKVIARDKNNHDALLGLAAIAVKQNRHDEAKRIYTRLLTLDNKDSYARAGLSALISQNKSKFNESQLKIMLREQPDAGHLHFALGNIMLQQKRYAEAQTAFFNAWTSSKSNTDYAYNLAVSLDHLGKPDHALEFYELTLKLSKSSGGNVNKDAIKQRIELIRDKQNG